MSVVLWIVGCLVLALLVAGAIFLLAPFSLSVLCRLSAEHSGVDLSFFWFHPLVLRASLAMPGKKFSAHFLKRFRVYPSRKSEEESPNFSGTEPSPPPRPEPDQSGPPHVDIDESVRPGPARPDTSDFSPDSGPSAASTHESDRESARRSAPSGLRKTAQGAKRFFAAIKRNKVLFILRQETWRKKIFRWAGKGIARFFRIVVLEKCKLQVQGNLQDPSVNGIVYGFATGIRSALAGASAPRYEISFEPVFDAGYLEANAEIRLKTSMIRVLFPIVAAAATFPYVSTFLVWRRLKKFSKRPDESAGESA
jgi:hypothetical protein